MNVLETADRLISEYPWLSIIHRNTEPVVGIIQKVTATHVWIYRYDKISGNEWRAHFIDLGRRWFYESDMEKPIDLFFGMGFRPFQECLVGYSNKEIADIIGPQINLNDQFKRRIKRKNFTVIEE